MSTKIGKARYGMSVQRKYFKLKEGEQAYRILPPIGNLADEGRWSVYHSVHYGYKTSDGKAKPFLSPEVKNRKTKMVEVADAAKQRIETLKADLEKAQKSGNKAVADKLEILVGQKGMYNLDNNHYMNVVDAQGNIGILKLRYKAKLALDMQIKSLNSDGVDPLSVENGRFFVFTRSGMGRDTTFAVKVLKEKITVPGVGVVERDVIHTLDQEIINRLEAEAGQLDKLFKSPTAEEVGKIVQTSSLLTGVSTYLDTLYARNNATANIVETTESEEDESESMDTVVVAPKTTIVKPVSAGPAAHKVVVTPVSQSVESLTDEDFLQKLNEGTL